MNRPVLSLFSLEGKIALVTGASSGLGRRALSVPTDVSDPEACTAAVKAAMDAFGAVDILVNNAGVGTAAPATHETPEQFRSVVAVNLSGVLGPTIA